MNLQMLCGIFNIISVVFAIAIALIVTRKYNAKFIIPWINANIAVVALLSLQLFPALEKPFPFAMMQLIMALAEGWFFLQTADYITGKNLQYQENILVGMIFVVCTIMILQGIPFKTTATLPALLIAIAAFRLGLLFLKPIDFLEGRGYAFWLGWPLIVMASMIPLYPLIHGRYDWLADFISSFMHILGGIGMAIYVLDQNNQKIAQAKMRYQGLFEQAYDGIILLDNTGKILDINTAGCALFGASKGSLVQQSLSKFIDTNPEQTGIEHSLLETTLLRPESPIPVEISFNNSGNGICEAIIRDISERNQISQLQKQQIETLLQADQIKDEYLTVISQALTKPLVELNELSSLLPEKDLNTAGKVQQIRGKSERMLRIIEELQDYSKAQGGFKMYFDLGKGDVR